MTLPWCHWQWHVTVQDYIYINLCAITWIDLDLNLDDLGVVYSLHIILHRPRMTCWTISPSGMLTALCIVWLTFQTRVYLFRLFTSISPHVSFCLLLFTNIPEVQSSFWTSCSLLLNYWRQPIASRFTHNYSIWNYHNSGLCKLRLIPDLFMFAISVAWFFGIVSFPSFLPYASVPLNGPQYVKVETI